MSKLSTDFEANKLREMDGERQTSEVLSLGNR